MKEFCPYCQNDPVTHQQQKEICGICDMEAKVAKRKNICSKCEHFGYCSMAVRYDGKVVMTGCSKFKEKRKQTRADKIRSLSNENLAQFLVDVSGAKDEAQRAILINYVKTWLQKEDDE